MVFKKLKDPKRPIVQITSVQTCAKKVSRNASTIMCFLAARVYYVSNASKATMKADKAEDQPIAPPVLMSLIKMYLLKHTRLLSL